MGSKSQINSYQTEINPMCSICGDMGWVTPDVPVGHEAFGKALQCNCRKQQDDPVRLAQLKRYSNLGRLGAINFASTNPNGRRTSVVDQELFNKSYETGLSFANDPQGWLVFSGPSGSGKTHLAAAIVNRVIESGNHALFIFVPDLLDHLRSTYTPNSDIPYDQLFEQVRSAPLLVLDDLGGQSATPWAQEKLYQIINYRYVARLPTIFTLSLPLEQLDIRWRTRLADVDIARICDTGSSYSDPDGEKWGNLDKSLAGRMTFDSFDTLGNAADRFQRQSLEYALAYARDFAKAPDGWLVFLGPTGCGKTHLSVAIANERLNYGDGVLYFLVADLLDYLRETFSPDTGVTLDKRFDEVRNVPLLVLRDFSTYHSTPWAREKLYQLLVRRHDLRLPTVITTRELDETKRSDPIVSRLLDITLVSVIPIDAPDYRYRGRVA